MYISLYVTQCEPDLIQHVGNKSGGDGSVLLEEHQFLSLVIKAKLLRY